MKPPTLLPRLTGSPFGALLLFGLYGAIWLGCYRGDVPAWLAGIAVLCAVATGNSVIEVQHYKRMMAAWEMGGQGSPEELAALRRKPSWFSILLAVALLCFIPTRHAPPGGTVMTIYVITWLLSALYLVFSFLKLAWDARRQKKVAARQTSEAEAAPVEYLVGRPGSSPSVSETTRNLPDYAAAILRRSGER